MADTRSGAQSRIAATLKRVKPAHVVCTNKGGEEIHVALTGSRMRWERAARTIVQCQAVSASLNDADGSVLELLDAAALGAESKALGSKPRRQRDDDDDDGEGSRGRELAELMRIALDAQDRAVARQQDLVREVVQSSVELARAATERADKLERILSATATKRELQLAAAADQLTALAADANASKDDGGSSELADQLIGMLAMRMGVPMPGKPGPH